MSGDPSIEADGLCKTYGGEVALAGLDLSIAAGEVYGFLGPNGAGKTTTMQLLATLRRPTSGTARVAGHSITDREALTAEIGYVPESPPLHDELSGREQLAYAAGLRDIPTSDAHDRIGSLLDRFGLADDADKRINAYSKGMRQKLSLAQAIVHDPAVVLLDEPTSGLDPRAARTVKEVITELADEETTVFLSTHILPVVDELADTVGVLYDGELVAEDAPSALKARVDAGEATLEDAFLSVTSKREPEPAPTQ